MNLKATKFEQPGPEDGQTLPIVHFVGNSRSMHASWDPNSNSTIRGKYFEISLNATSDTAKCRSIGTVRLTPEGEIRWTTFSIYHGYAYPREAVKLHDVVLTNNSEERWRSEGIQIGGRNSARGVFGNWFDKCVIIFGSTVPPQCIADKSCSAQRF